MRKELCLTAILMATALGCSREGRGFSSTVTSGDVQSTNSSAESQSYQFELNGCPTGLHEFKTSNGKEAKVQMCGALQDDLLNGFCAEDLRREFFNKSCTGMLWSPTGQNQIPDSEAKTTEPTPVNPIVSGGYTMDQAREALKFAMVDKFEMAPSLDDDQKALITSLNESMASCGLSYLGPQCLDDVTYIGSTKETANPASPAMVFSSELRLNEIKTPIVFKFPINKTNNGFNVNQLLVYQQQGQNEIFLGSFTLVNKAENEIWKRLESPRDLRQLYHMARLILDNSANTPEGRANAAKVSEQLVKNLNMIGESKDAKYQEEILQLSENSAPVATALMKSSSVDVAQLAACTLFSLQPGREDLKADVIMAMNSPRGDIRKRSIQTLAKSAHGYEDERSIIAKIADKDEDVSDAAIQASENLKLVDGHLEILRSLLLPSQRWQVRLAAVNLLSKINSEASTQELLIHLSDPYDDIRSVVFTQLNQRELNGKHIDMLSKLLDDVSKPVRKIAAKLLGKIKSADAAKVLQARLEKETDSEVKSEIQSALKAPKN